MLEMERAYRKYQSGQGPAIDFRLNLVCCFSRMDSTVPLTHYDPKGLGLICLAKERKIHFWDSFGFKNTI